MPPLNLGVCTTVWKVLFLTHISLANLVDQLSFGDFDIPDVTSHDRSMHGGVKMGEINDKCDNAKDRLDVDLARMSEMVRACPLYLPPCVSGHGKRVHHATTHFCKAPVQKCSKTADMPIHECMDKDIFYDDEIPTRRLYAVFVRLRPANLSGAHRPNWPVYGEYYYAPPQRWLHSLEHGAAVFLYHPCANLKQLNAFKTLAKSCLRRHIITPYNLTQEWPFAILTWTCRLMLDRVDTNMPTAVEFLKSKTLRTYESNVYQDGNYNFLLKEKAAIVKDKRDSVVCPTLKLKTTKRFP